MRSELTNESAGMQSCNAIRIPSGVKGCYNF